LFGASATRDAIEDLHATVRMALPLSGHYPLVLQNRKILENLNFLQSYTSKNKTGVGFMILLLKYFKIELLSEAE
jgi:hypothetical protein